MIHQKSPIPSPGPGGKDGGFPHEAFGIDAALALDLLLLPLLALLLEDGVREDDDVVAFLCFVSFRFSFILFYFWGE